MSRKNMDMKQRMPAVGLYFSFSLSLSTGDTDTRVQLCSRTHTYMCSLSHTLLSVCCVINGDAIQ